MNNLREMIDLLWSINREAIFQEIEENAEYSQLLMGLRTKEEAICSKIESEQSNKVMECLETRVLLNAIASQRVYQEGFREGIKTMMQIVEVCKAGSKNTDK